MVAPLTVRADASAEASPSGGSGGSWLSMAEGGSEPGDDGPGPGPGLALVEGSAGRAGRAGDPGDLVALAQQVQQVRAGSQRRGCRGRAGLAVRCFPDVSGAFSGGGGLGASQHVPLLSGGPDGLLVYPVLIPAILHCPLPVCRCALPVSSRVPTLLVSPEPSIALKCFPLCLAAPQ